MPGRILSGVLPLAQDVRVAESQRDGCTVSITRERKVGVAEQSAVHNITLKAPMYTGTHCRSTPKVLCPSPATSTTTSSATAFFFLHHTSNQSNGIRYKCGIGLQCLQNICGSAGWLIVRFGRRAHQMQSLVKRASGQCLHRCRAQSMPSSKLRRLHP